MEYHGIFEDAEVETEAEAEGEAEVTAGSASGSRAGPRVADGATEDQRDGRFRFTPAEDALIKEWVRKHANVPSQGAKLWTMAERAQVTRAILDNLCKIVIAAS